MAFLMFSLSKQALTARLSNLNFRLMELQDKEKQYANEMSDRERVNDSFYTQASTDLNAQYQADLTDIQVNYSGETLSTKISELTQAKNAALQEIQNMLNADATLKELKVLTNDLDLEKQNIETQISVANADLEATKTAEDTSISSSAPSLF